MSGENELRPSSWTVDTLKDHLQSQHDSLVKMLDERAANQTKAIDAALAAADKLVQTALVSAEKAVDKANDANEKRFESVNEFRGQLTDQATTFARREEIDVRFKALTDRIDADSLRSSERLATLESRIDLGKGNREGAATAATTSRANSQIIIAGIGLLLVVISVSVAIIVAFKK